MDRDGDVRLTFYHPSFERGGLERFTIDTANALAEQGVRVDVLTGRRSQYVDQFDDAVSVRTVSAPAAVEWVLRVLLPVQVAVGVASIPGLVAYLSRHSPNLFLSVQLHVFGVAVPALLGTDATVVLRESNFPSRAATSSDLRVGWLAPHAKRLVYPLADELVAISEGARDDVAEFLGLDPDSISVVYNPTYNDRLGALAEEPIDHAWFEDDRPVVASSGRFSDQKDFETLLKAFAHLSDTTDARLVLLGDGKNRDRLEALASELGIDEETAFLGYVDNPHGYVARADLYVFSSNFEGLGNALVEAVGVGTPVVATDCPGGPSDTLLDGEGGWLVPVGDEAAMAASMREALEDGELAADKLSRARAGLERFTPERIAEQYLAMAR